MITAAIIGIIAALSLYIVLEPIILNVAVPIREERERGTISIHYHEALRELEYELEAGKIDREEYERLKEELKYQMGIDEQSS